jgi:ABC-type lipoprotein release transport system permease subunit
VLKVHEHTEGDYLEEGDMNQIIIGKELAGTYDPIDPADNLLGSAYEGDKVKVFHENGVNKTYKIKGIMNTGSQDGDDRMFITRAEYESVFGPLTRATLIVVRLNEDDIEEEAITEFLNEGIDAEITDTLDYSGGDQMADTFKVIQLVTSIVAFAVSLITLFIVIYINALNKKKHIAIMKAIGVGRGTVIFSFVLQSFFYAASGVLLGSLLIFLGLVPYFQANPLQMDFGQVRMIVHIGSILPILVIFLSASLIAGFIPAYAVSKRDIITTMRE